MRGGSRLKEKNDGRPSAKKRQRNPPFPPQLANQPKPKKKSARVMYKGGLASRHPLHTVTPQLGPVRVILPPVSARYLSGTRLWGLAI